MPVRIKNYAALLVAALALLTFRPALAQGTLPRFESGSCDFALPPGTNPACGMVVVPEDHNHPGNGKTIQLAVAVFKSTAANPAPDPIIYLDGGPGGNSLKVIQYNYASLVEPLLAYSDVVIFDQRGVGLSQPALNCTELTDMTYATLEKNLSTDENIQMSLAAISQCHDRLAGEGIDFSVYTSAQNAADVDNLRIALGYDQMNLLGISYGTKLALTTMRDHPAAIRSVLIDSVYPLQVSYLDTPLNANRAFNVLFDGCAADSACNAAFPDLKKVFNTVYDQLNATPLTVQVADPISNREIKAVVNGDSFVGLLFQALYSAELIPELPKAIYDAKNGKSPLLAALITQQLFELDYVSYGMFTAVQCNEDLAFDPPTKPAAVLANVPVQLRGFAREGLVDPSTFAMCSAWAPTKPNPIENEAVSSDIPTLVYAGQYDPITPPAYGKLAAKSLKNSRYYEFPGVGHGAITTGTCPQDIAVAFFKDPTAEPDSSCIASMGPPKFKTAANAAIQLKPYQNDAGTFTAVVPDGWLETQPGVFQKGAAGLDQNTGLLLQVLPADKNTVLPLLSTQLKLDSPPPIVGTRSANGLDWSLYQFQITGYPADLALAERGGTTYMIMLISGSLDERDALYSAVFLPVIDAFTVTG